jgi:3-oxoacyl-[acyl-carrier protein] reductase
VAVSLDGKTCVVTGSSRGIGRGVAEALGREGANVVVNYATSESAAYDVVEAVEREGGSAVALQADVADLDEMQRFGERVHHAFGPVDVLVNNAGITVDRTFAEMTREDWDRVMDVNLGGVFNATKVFFDDLRAADHGRLVNVSSVVGQQGNYGQSNYAATKSGMLGFTRTLALELAASGSTANCVAPGFTRTDMLEEVRDDILERIRERIPLDRFAEVEDVAAAVRFLASEESSYVTGQVISINGGMEQ